jgi:hypothetical protein
MIDSGGREGVGAGMRLKAFTFRSYIKLLVKDGRRDAVMALVPPETAALIADPPLAGSWMDLQHINNISVAIETIAGMAAVRDLARRGTDEARKPYMGVVESVLKLFGTSPATLFKRMNSLVSSFIEGIDYRFTSTTPRSGVMEVAYKTDHEVPICVFVSGMMSFQVLLDACGVKGAIDQPERLGPNKARYQIRW